LVGLSQKAWSQSRSAGAGRADLLTREQVPDSIGIRAR